MNMIKTADTLLSDMYKDAHGFRPRGVYPAEMTEAEYRAEVAHLQQVIDDEEARLKEVGMEALVEFERHITAMINMGAGDRETALRWFADSLGHEDYRELKFNLGYELQYKLGIHWDDVHELTAEILAAVGH